MDWDDVRRLCLELPGVEESSSYGTPATFIAGKGLVRFHQGGEDIVLFDVGFDEREMLMQAAPAVFHITPHYKDWPSVLARLSAVTPDDIRGLIERRWRKVAPKKLLAQRPEA